MLTKVFNDSVKPNPIGKPVPTSLSLSSILLFPHLHTYVYELVGVCVCVGGVGVVRKRERKQGNDLWFNSLESQLRSIIQTSEEELRPVVLYRKTKTDRSGERQALNGNLFWELFSQF